MIYYSICVPVYNRATTIVRTLDSIRNQDFSEYEVIIVDDGSTDDTPSIIARFLNENNDDRFRVIHKKNGGKHSALNVGIEKAKGVFFIILDSDDWLTETALDDLYPLCKKIENDSSFCGVMGKSRDNDTGKMIGDQFDLSNPVSSYFDFHFVIAQKLFVQDCFEATKTDLLKPYRFPEKEGMRFVPEAWLFDQLGVSYNLLLSNTIFREKQYLDDGMTKNPNFKNDNVEGFLYHYISRIENVIEKKRMNPSLKLKLLVLSWWRYWECVKLDKEKKGPRISKVSIFGYFIKVCTPVINVLFKKLYPNYS